MCLGRSLYVHSATSTCAGHYHMVLEVGLNAQLASDMTPGSLTSCSPVTGIADFPHGPRLNPFSATCWGTFIDRPRAPKAAAIPFPPKLHPRSHHLPPSSAIPTFTPTIQDRHNGSCLPFSRPLN